jgi:hypothetical protein
MSRSLPIPLVAIAVSFFLSACAQQKQAETPPPPEQSSAAAMAIELTPEKVTELAQIAAQIDKAPDTIADILKARGYSQEQYDQAIAKIAADSTMNAMFQQAKTAAVAGTGAMGDSTGGAMGAADTTNMSGGAGGDSGD